LAAKRRIPADGRSGSRFGSFWTSTTTANDRSLDFLFAVSSHQP